MRLIEWWRDQVDGVRLLAWTLRIKWEVWEVRRRDKRRAKKRAKRRKKRE